MDFDSIAAREAKRAIANREIEEQVRFLSTKKRKSPSVLFLGRVGFSDNCKYLYLAMAARAQGLPVFWGTFNPRLYAELTRRGLPALDLTAEPARVLSVLFEMACVVYCTNPAEACGSPLFRAALAGAYKLQLWHGIGLKTLELQNTADGNLLHARWLTQLCGAADIDEVLSPSSLYDEQWREAFGVERVLRAGFPRNEVLCRAPTEHESIDAPELPDVWCARGFVLYAPTFTRRDVTPVWLDPKLLDVLEGFASRVGLGLAIKPHPFDRQPTTAENARFNGNTRLIDAHADVYPVLRHARALVTDVSSLASDFLLCDQPVMFFRSPTLEQKNYPQRCLPELPGRHVCEESVEAFVSAWDSIRETAPARRRLRELYFETDPLTACDAIAARVVEIVDQKTQSKRR